METGNKTVNNPAQRDTDADISLLLYKTGKAFKQFLLWIGRGFKRIEGLLLMTLLFLFRNFIWLLVGLILGLSYGLYKQTKASGYTSQMVVKANYNSSRALYNAVDYLNALISTAQTNELSSIFGISQAEAGSLSDFSVEPVESEMIIAGMYKEEFFQPEKFRKVRLDTFWTRTIKYEDFKESLTKYDYPYQTVNAYTTNPKIFSRLGKGISDLIAKNPLLSGVNHQQSISNADEEKLLVSSINNLDSLRKAYNERLIKGESIVPPGNQMTIMEGTNEMSTPELELYDKMRELQAELKRSRARSATEKNIIEIYSPFNAYGEKISLLQTGAWWALYGFLLALGILLLIAFYKWLVVFESSYKARNMKKAV